jgi:hypothetical protein
MSSGRGDGVDCLIHGHTVASREQFAQSVRKKSMGGTMVRAFRWRRVSVTLLTLLVGTAPALAQHPTQAQTSALRQACRNDYMTHCSNVPTGGVEALQCLERHETAVSMPCQQALAALKLPATAAAAATPTKSSPEPSAMASGVAAGSTATGSWPHSFSKNGSGITVFQPQAISWSNRRKLTARAAIAITPAGQTKQVFGTLQISVETHIDNATGIVSLSDPILLESHFPSLDTQRAATLDAKIRTDLPRQQMPTVPLASILLSLGQSPIESVAVNNDPPTIFYASRPASLIVFDGEPVVVPIKGTALSHAVNTNWDIFVYQNTWYLLDNGLWLSAPAVSGPYEPVRHLPAVFLALPKDSNFSGVRKFIPAAHPKSADQTPTVLVSLKPADIIVTEGEPHLAPVSGTGLKRVLNSPNALFFDPAQSKFYVLLSGRWFAASDLNGPWTFATDDLPPDFAMIPPEGSSGAVLASIPGTVQSQEAVLRAQIPVTATLNRSDASITVLYAGPPKFQPIPGTSILHAVNTASVVLKIDEKYYACENGAWFVARSPTGPWILADSLPPVIKTIPPNSPLYPVTYVQIYGMNPTTVTYGYTAGYLMGYVSAGVLVYGTGYYYPPVVLPGRVPVYYPYPYTYGAAVYYNSSTGAWLRTGTVYGPYGGGATGGRYYNPTTGAWAQGGAIYGPNGGAGAWSAYNPTTGSYAHGSASWSNGSGFANANFYNGRNGVSGSTSQNWNPYSRWGSSTFTGPSQTVHSQSASNANGSAGGLRSSSGAEGAGYHNKITGNSGGAVKTTGGDVYAGRDGNVYKHTDDGWSKWSNGGWNSVQPPNNGQHRLQGRNQLGSSQGGRFGNHTMDASNYRQLQWDQLGRSTGGGGLGTRFHGGGGALGGRRWR